MSSPVDAVERELSRMQNGLFDSWKVYMTWYTWFFGANLIVLGWLFSSNIKISADRSLFLSGAWFVANLTGAIATWRLMRFTEECKSKARELVTVITKSAPGELAFDPEFSFPAALGSVGAKANILALLINMLLWSYLCVRSIF